MTKLQLPLRWSLTLSIFGVLIIIVVTLIFIFQTLISRIDDRLRHTMLRYQLANAMDVVSSIEYEVIVEDKKALETKIKGFMKKEREIHSISVLNRDESILYTSGNRATIDNILRTVAKADKTTHIVDTNSVVMLPISSEEGGKSGTLVHVMKLDTYLQDKRHLSLGILISGMIGLLVILASVYFIGRRASMPFHRLVEAAQRFANGDLRRTEVVAHGAKETLYLAGSIQSMAESIQTQVLEIKDLTVEVSEISQETEGTMTNLASSASQQAAAVNETAATVEELEKSGQSSAGNARQIVTSSEKTMEASTRGRQTVEKTYKIMMQIKDDSQEISEKSRDLLNAVEEVGNIIQSVNSIAEQSKILAVNASIEAAKAGEYGAGFAVVAQEVKDLAQQSKDATVQITGTLTAIRAAIETMVSTAQSGKTRTEEGVNTIANAGAVMNDLSEAIQENSNFANVIAGNIKQQTIGLTQIAAAIEEINASALENQSISRNMVVGTRQLNDSLGRLSELVRRWKTPEEST